MQGSLSEFRLAEILQLVAVQQKTGLLRLARGKQVVVFYFDHGLLVASRDRRHMTHDPLFAYLNRTGYLQPEMTEFLRTRMEGSKEDLADVLLGERFLTEDELQTALYDLAQELVHDTFTWREGTYQFIGGEEALTGLRHLVALKIDAVLMEGARRADEWPRLRERLPGPEVVIDLAHSPTSLGERAYGVLSQIVGVMRLGEIVARARVPEFEVYEVVAQAVDAGVVRIVSKPLPAAPVVVEPCAPRPAAAPRSRLWAVPRPLGWALALLLSVLSAIGAWCVAPRLTSPGTRAAVQTLESAKARDELRRCIEVYRALHGRCPTSLADLGAEALASTELLHRAAPLHYAPIAGGRGFRLSDLAAEPRAAPGEDAAPAAR